MPAEDSLRHRLEGVGAAPAAVEVWPEPLHLLVVSLHALEHTWEASTRPSAQLSVAGSVARYGFGRLRHRSRRPQRPTSTSDAVPVG
jgi:hypothetical protein